MKFCFIRRSIKIVGLIFALPMASAFAVQEMVQNNSQSAINLQQKTDVIDAAMKAAPPVAVSGATILGVSVNEILVWATLFWVFLQSAFLIYKWRRLHKEKPEE